MTLSYQVWIDWDNDGFFAAGDLISDRVSVIAEVSRGLPDDPLVRLADVGKCTIVVDNTDRHFSPDNTASPYYGKLKPGRPMRVAVTTDAGQELLFTGYIKAIRPSANLYGDRTCEIEAEDLIGRLQADFITAPVLENVTADQLVGVILQKSDPSVSTARGNALYAANPADGDWIQISYKGVVWAKYIYRTTLTATPNEIKIGATLATTLANLKAAANAEEGEGVLYSSGTARAKYVTASSDATRIYFEAVTPGAWGNSINLARHDGGSTTAITFAGGTNGLSADSEVGINLLEVSGDTWGQSGDDTNAMSALESAVNAEQGLLWINSAGEMVFKNQQFIFRQNAASIALTLNDQGGEFYPEQSADRVFNRVIVSYTPRSTTSGAIRVAEANNVIEVPGNSGIPRSNPNTPITTAHNVVILPAIDVNTGRIAAIKSIELPLVPGVNYTVYDTRDKSGFDYTLTGRISITAAVNGANVELSFVNTASGTLYVHDLYIEGIAYLSYDAQQIMLDDTTSQAEYGRRAVQLELPFPTADSKSFAVLLAQYLLSHYANPRTDVETWSISGYTDLAGVNLLSLDIGSIIRIIDTQTALDRMFMIAGINHQFLAGERPTVTYRLRVLENESYWRLDTNSILGSSTRLAL